MVRENYKVYYGRNRTKYLSFLQYIYNCERRNIMFEIIGIAVIIYAVLKCYAAFKNIAADEKKNNERINDGWIDYRINNIY